MWDDWHFSEFILVNWMRDRICIEHPLWYKKERISRIISNALQTSKIQLIRFMRVILLLGWDLRDLRYWRYTLFLRSKPIVLESMTFPDPVIGVAVEPKTVKKTLNKLGYRTEKTWQKKIRLSKLRYDEDTNQTVISGMGELHLEIIVDRSDDVNLKWNVTRVHHKLIIKKLLTQNYRSHRERLKKADWRLRFVCSDVQFELGPADEGIPRKRGI